MLCIQYSVGSKGWWIKLGSTLKMCYTIVMAQAFGEYKYSSHIDYMEYALYYYKNKAVMVPRKYDELD